MPGRNSLSQHRTKDTTPPRADGERTPNLCALNHMNPRRGMLFLLGEAQGIGFLFHGAVTFGPSIPRSGIEGPNLTVRSQFSLLRVFAG